MRPGNEGKICMQPLTKNLFDQKHSWAVISALFFVVSYLYLTLVVRVELVFYYFMMCRKTPIFKTSGSFLWINLSVPGGLTQYLASLFTQLCYFPWLGSLFIILIGWGLYLLTTSLLDIKADSILRIVCFVPAIIILMICSRYETPFGFGVAVLFVMLVAVLYKKISVRMGWLRIILFLIFSAALYYFAGAAVLIFVLWAALFELFERRKLIFCLTCLLLGTAVAWFVGRVLFGMDDSNSYLYFIPLVQTAQIIQQEKLSKFLSIVFIVFVPAAVLSISICRVLFRKTGDSRLQKLDNKLGWSIRIILIIIAASFILLSYNWKVKNTLLVNYFASQQMWSKVLTVVRKGALKNYFPYCNNAVNRALFHTGRMGDEMFTFFQTKPDSDLVFNRNRQYNINYLERTEVCLDLGMVNVAEELAYEFLAGTDDNPYILKQLALINLVKGQIESAGVYLNALSRYPVFRRQAMVMLRQLEKDPLLEHDSRIQYLRNIMDNNDLTFISYDEEIWLNQLLSRNKTNKMAFEYLMAYYLLNRKLDKFVENLPRLDDFGYENIPLHYQEAILLYIGTTRKEDNKDSWPIDTEVVAMYNEINKIAADSVIKDLNIMRKILEPKYSGTYFFYYTFGYSK
jgi:hypothetical protein